MNSETIKTIFLGSAGVAGQEAVQVVTALDTAPITEGVGLISQIIILVATLIGLFRKKKNV
jgi:hypothetical protein